MQMLLTDSCVNGQSTTAIWKNFSELLYSDIKVCPEKPVWMYSLEFNPKPEILQHQHTLLITFIMWNS